jgi:FKBP-type peptidyl-prolyl cis-trans isomerase FklB
MNKLSYSLGASVAFNIKNQGLAIENVEDFMAAIQDVFKENELAIAEEEIGKIINDYFTELQAKTTESAISSGKAFLAENAKRAEVITLESGLQYEIITEGNGEKPTINDVVTTHYHGSLIDGNVFDSSVYRGQPASFPVNGVIKGWTEALQLMAVGSKWKLYVPYDLAYGEQGAGQAIAPYSTLIFEVELLEIKK